MSSISTMDPVFMARRLLESFVHRNFSFLDTMLAPQVSLEIWCHDRCQTYSGVDEVKAAWLTEVARWQKPTLHIREWSNQEYATAISFQIWVYDDEETRFEYDHLLKIVVLQDKVTLIRLICEDVNCMCHCTLLDDMVNC